MPTARTELAVALLDGRMYVAGGFGGPAAFESYDPETDSWATHRSLPLGLDHPSLAALGGQVYLTGGSQAQLWAYDPESDSWSVRAPMPQARYAAAAVTVGEAMYVIGGSGVEATNVLRYDPATDSWSVRGQLAQVRDHVAAVALDGKVYILGGRNLGALNSTAIYDPSAETVTPGPNMMDSRSGFGAAAVGPFVCAAGGEVLGIPSLTRQTAECWDTRDDTWAWVDNLPRPLHGVGAVGLEDRMYFFGGAEVAASAVPALGWVYILEP